jgi:hypothetical protein
MPLPQPVQPIESPKSTDSVKSPSEKVLESIFLPHKNEGTKPSDATVLENPEDLGSILSSKSESEEGSKCSSVESLLSLDKGFLPESQLTQSEHSRFQRKKKVPPRFSPSDFKTSRSKTRKSTSDNIDNDFCCGRQLVGDFVECSKQEDCQNGQWFHYRVKNGKPCVYYDDDCDAETSWYCPKCADEKLEPFINNLLKKNPMEVKNEDTKCVKEASQQKLISLEKACDILNRPVPETKHYVGSEFSVLLPKEKACEIIQDGKLIPGKYNPIISKYIMRQTPLPCSFVVRRKYEYVKGSKSIANVFGKCGGKNGECKMELECLFKRPDGDGNIPCVVTANGLLLPHHEGKNGRPIRGPERDALKEQSKVDSPKLLLAKRIAEASVEEILHGNHPQKSLDVLQKISSEKNLLNRFNRTSLIKDTEDVQRVLLSYPNSETKNRNMKPGFLHEISINPYEVAMYLPAQPHFTASAGRVNLYIDMTEGIYERNGAKKLFHYSAIGEFPELNAAPIPVFELASEQLNSIGLGNQLSQWVRDCRVVDPKFQPSMVVTDFSLCMLHGVSRSINREELMIYINRAWDTMHFKEPVLPSWDKKSPLTVCQAHIIHAWAINIRKLNLSKQHHITAMSAFVKLMESPNFKDTELTLKRMLLLFEQPRMTANQHQDLKDFFKNHDDSTDGLLKSYDDFEFTKRTDDELEELMSFQPGEDVNARDKSPFYKYFVQLRKDAPSDCVGDGAEDLVNNGVIVNPFWKPEIIDYLEKYYMAYFPLWSEAALPPGLKGKTTAHVESHFRTLKHQYHPKGRYYAPEMFENHYTVISGLTCNAVVNATVGKKVGPSSSSMKGSAETTKEIFMKKATKQREPKYLKRAKTLMGMTKEIQPAKKQIKLDDKTGTVIELSEDEENLCFQDEFTQDHVSTLAGVGEHRAMNDVLMSHYMKELIRKNTKTAKDAYFLPPFFAYVGSDRKLCGSPRMFPKIAHSVLQRSYLYGPVLYLDHWFLTRLVPVFI